MKKGSDFFFLDKDKGNLHWKRLQYLLHIGDFCRLDKDSLDLTFWKKSERKRWLLR